MLTCVRSEKQATDFHSIRHHSETPHYLTLSLVSRVYKDSYFYQRSAST